MPNSTISLATVFDTIAAKGVPDPRGGPSGYGDTLALEIASEVIADLLGGAVDGRGDVTRFNWKFNRAAAIPFQLNSWQQDYPQLAQPGGIIGWGEDCDILDINNTVLPKPLNWDGAVTWKKQLTRTSLSRWRPSQISWMYNKNLNFGTWPGPNITFYPLLTPGPNPQNPIMSMIDANGNLLIVDVITTNGAGTTGSTPPSLPANSAEGARVSDGIPGSAVVWVCVSPTSQGFRMDWLPNATSPNYQILPYYQIEPPRFTTFAQMLDPIPDSFSRHFFRGLEAGMYIASPNPGDLKRGQEARAEWMASLVVMTGQANKETDAYQLVPITQPVERRWQNDMPYTADQPY
jgi:hypothetical protein